MVRPPVLQCGAKRSAPEATDVRPAFAAPTRRRSNARRRTERQANGDGAAGTAPGSILSAPQNGQQPYGRRATDRAPIILDVRRFAQPDDETCGPTCLAQVYRYYGHQKGLRDVIRDVPRNPDGGTLGVYLGTSALRDGFNAWIYSYNLRVFDPTWHRLGPAVLLRKLRKRVAAVESVRLRRTLEAYVEFLELGGKVVFREFSKKLLVGLLDRGRPILCGLSATYLYRSKREFQNRFDDVRGTPVGHFVVICGYYPRSDRFMVRDPSSHIPFSRSGRYSVDAERLVAAILLGDVTYDADLLVLAKKR